MCVPPKGDSSQHGRRFRANAVAADQMLSTIGGKGKGFRGSADQAIPQNPAAFSGRVLLCGHGLCLPRDQGMKRIGRNDRPAADANGAQATSRNVIIDSGPAQAGCPAGFPNAVTDLRGIVLDGLHGIGPIWPARLCGGLHGTTSYGFVGQPGR